MSDIKLPPIPTRLLTEDMPLKVLIQEAYENSAAHGFHQGEENMTPLQRLGKYMLMVTEVAEAVEEVRQGDMEVLYDHLPNDPRMHMLHERFALTKFDKDGNQTGISLGKPVGILSEEADIIIRVFDEVGRRGQIEAFVRVLIEKMLWNRTRPVMHGKNC